MIGVKYQVIRLARLAGSLRGEEFLREYDDELSAMRHIERYFLDADPDERPDPRDDQLTIRRVFYYEWD